MADGKIRRINDASDLKPGSIVRPQGDTSPYSDSVVVSSRTVDYQLETVTYYTLARPYAYVTLANTLCAGVVTGVEQHTVPFKSLQDRYVVVMTDRENLYDFTLKS